MSDEPVETGLVAGNTRARKAYAAKLATELTAAMSAAYLPANPKFGEIYGAWQAIFDMVDKSLTVKAGEG